jgi:hypothetical protein
VKRSHEKRRKQLPFPELQVRIRPPFLVVALVGDSRGRPVELRNMDRERLVVGLGLISEHAERDRLSQQQ